MNKQRPEPSEPVSTSPEECEGTPYLRAATTAMIQETTTLRAPKAVRATSSSTEPSLTPNSPLESPISASSPPPARSSPSILPSDYNNLDTFYTGRRTPFVPSRSVSPREVGSLDSRSIDHALSQEDTQHELVAASGRNSAAVMELDLDCNVMFLGKSWESIVGTRISKIVHRPINDLIVGETEDRQVFNKATGIMMVDDESYRVKFVVRTNKHDEGDTSGNQSDVLGEENAESDSGETSTDNTGSPIDIPSMDASSEASIEDPDDSLRSSKSLESSESLDLSVHSSTSTISTDGGYIELEAQGILIHDQKTRKPTHSMWVVKPWVPLRELTLELPEELIMKLGFGVNLFESYLMYLTELGIIDEDNLPLPPQELCRICEQRVPNWWLEKHTELCLVEHKAEDTVQLKQENLLEHRKVVENILEALSGSASPSPSSTPSSSSSSSSSSSPSLSSPSYKGFPIPLTPSESNSLHRRKSVGSILPSRRFPFKNLNMLLQYCDEALRVNPGEIRNDEKNANEEYIISYSPDSEKALRSLSQTEIPESSDNAIKLLAADTEALAHEKIESIDRYAHTLQYVDKITRETDEMVLQSVKETISRIKEQVYSYSEAAEEDDAGAVLPIQSPRPANKLGGSTILDTEGGMTPRSGSVPRSGSSTTPVIHVAGEEVSRGGSANRSLSPSNYNSPRRPLSPGLTVPMSSIQRNSRSGPAGGGAAAPPAPGVATSAAGAGAGAGSIGGGPPTPISSPLFLASDAPSSASSGLDRLDRPQLSPLLVPQSAKQTAPSIRDYEVIKPISKGAFGSVFLTKRKLTGEYFAIKVLKKADMVSKNQVTNVKAERAIMMAQANSPYVVQLVATFQSTNYLYLVMEYLNGGDLATLLKNMGYLPDMWARRYIAEVIVGVDDLHSKGIVHRDLKPDNLLIDRNGHIKLTDFGLSRMGLVRRQNLASSEVIEDPFGESVGGGGGGGGGGGNGGSVSSAGSSSTRRRPFNITPFSLSPGSPLVTPNTPSTPAALVFEDLDSPGGSPLLRPLTRRMSLQPSFVLSKDDAVPSSGEITDYALFNPQHSAETRKFVGTPDYLAPETVAGLGQDEASDWWSIGCILFEFLFGYPPFSGDSPKEVFENILHGDIQWPALSRDELAEFCSESVRDLIVGLLVKEPTQRLGSGGSREIMEHPYFAGICWDTLFAEEASFVPATADPESTEYFDDRGAQLLVFPDDEGSAAPAGADTATAPGECSLMPPPPPPLAKRERRGSRLTDGGGGSEFGSFQFRNLAVLEKQNKDAINRLRNEHIEHRNSISSTTSSEGGYFSASASGNCALAHGSAPTTPAGSISGPVGSRPRGLSASLQLSTPFKRSSSPNIFKDFTARSPGLLIAPSPEESSGGVRHASPAPGTRSTGSPAMRLLSKSFSRPVSDFSPSSSDNEERSRSGSFRGRKRRSSRRLARHSSSSATANEAADALQKMVIDYFDVLLCEPIPIHRYSIEKNLHKLGCDVVVVSSGSELIKRSTGSVKFDLILTSTELHKLDCVDLVKLIKHTSTVNSQTCVVALTSFYQDAVDSGVFEFIVEYPVTMEKLRGVIDEFRRRRREEEAIVTDTE